jgi:galactokinase
MSRHVAGGRTTGRQLANLERTVAEFRRRFGGAPKVYRAPGRVNLIGEHTDYNDGFVLPAALELATLAAIAPRRDRTLRVHSLLMDETVTFALDDADAKPRRHWSDYVHGVAVVFESAGHRLTGADLMIDSDVPLGAGLSSSAALEVATGYALLGNSGLRVDLTRLALACQRAENSFVGMRCGIMDQFIACHGAAGHALLIDCRTLTGRLVPIDPKVRLVICNTMVHHAHAAGEYNLRRQDCEEGVRRLAAALPGIKALRDVTPDQLERHADLLTPVIYRRCRHVVSENERTVRAADALHAGDLILCGRLMGESHVSMRDDFEISCHEVDVMVALNAAADGVYGARMTGGGFGGSTISLVEAGAVDAFRHNVASRYRAATGLEPQIFTSPPGAGVGAVG